MTVKELRKEISKNTAQLNVQIQSYRESGKPVKAFDTSIEYLKHLTGRRSGARGEIAASTRGLKKVELETRLHAVNRLIKMDMYSDVAQEAYRSKRYSSKAKASFIRRFGYMSDSDFEALYDTFSTVRNMLQDYGYEAVGGDLAEQFHNVKSEKKKNFADYVQKAWKQKKAQKPEEFIDTLYKVLQEEDAI